MSVDQRLAQLGIRLPQAAAPVASYRPVIVHAGVAYVSGQLPFINGELVTGQLGENVSLEEGAAATRACALMILAQLKAALIPLDRVAHVVKLGAFINSTSDFTDQPKVANGASELMFDVFGDIGRHARSAVGVPSLPLGVAVEVDAIIALHAH
jgi:enamine deaminase RidA (YjgF/YER057c/UK114 family)